MAKGRVFLIESPNALDLLSGTGEANSLAQVCRLFGHEIATFLVKDRVELKRSMMYVSSIGWQRQRGKRPVFIHISAHGNRECLGIGPDDVSWKELSALVVKTFQRIHRGRPKPYRGPIALVISSCGANGEVLAHNLCAANKEGKLQLPPQYLFTFNDEEVYWSDAVVAWTMFYGKILNIDFAEPKDEKELKRLIDSVRDSGFGELRCFRWDQKKSKYRHYASKAAKV